ncbi:predicted protein [Plenodomus lingam JN3]|uniref:Predicted protein n=1 Tax=Leptosphaeria maculans (strain JN3 / isolate v23.1.3 / race Av1-4-5-6-7-8) TaxID=985895 RepID=E5A2S3_LEPMJ|nr:predicted protein [Plenodomus lingam JN3]CBX97869.1 predicted protein [Plenodomus lingam JN3]
MSKDATKLANFGSAFFRGDFTPRRIVQYLGTTKYHIPETASRHIPGKGSM